MFNPTVTDNEHKVLRALATNHYSSGDGPSGATWANCINDANEPSGIEGKPLSGVVSSLVKKGWIKCEHDGKYASVWWASDEAYEKANTLPAFNHSGH